MTMKTPRDTSPIKKSPDPPASVAGRGRVRPGGWRIARAALSLSPDESACGSRRGARGPVPRGGGKAAASLCNAAARSPRPLQRGLDRPPSPLRRRHPEGVHGPIRSRRVVVPAGSRAKLGWRGSWEPSPLGGSRDVAIGSVVKSCRPGWRAVRTGAGGDGPVLGEREDRPTRSTRLTERSHARRSVKRIGRDALTWGDEHGLSCSPRQTADEKGCARGVPNRIIGVDSLSERVQRLKL